MAVVYLTVENVVEIHRQTMESMGPPSYPLRSECDPDGAIHRPQWAARFERIDVVEQAARLAVEISEEQVFMEGNKRTGFESMRVFPRVNGYRLIGPPLVAAEWLLKVAESPDASRRAVVEARFATWLRDDVADQPLPDSSG